LIHRWLARHPRYLHFTPTSASWLNLVERWFPLLSEKQIKRGGHCSTRALEAAITAYIALGNSSPKPFVWTEDRRRDPRQRRSLLSSNLQSLGRTLAS
jgi:hypothetical protein